VQPALPAEAVVVPFNFRTDGTSANSADRAKQKLKSKHGYFPLLSVRPPAVTASRWFELHSYFATAAAGHADAACQAAC
jgi:hypothetical protein